MVRRLSTVLVVGVMAMTSIMASVGGVVAAVRDATPAAAQGCSPRLVVSKTTGLAAAGDTVTVSGSCYDVTKGVYVAFCVVPRPGAVPSPCGGGVDMSGANGLSHWISSNPPAQGVGLTTPYGPGGSFTVTMRPSSQLNASVDCRRTSCAVVTRNDHTRASDRSQDVIVPVTFAADPAPATTVAPVAAPPAPAAGPSGADAAPAPDASTTTTVAEATTPTSDTAASPPTTTPVGDDEGSGDEGGGADELAAEPVSAASGGSGGAALAVAGGVVVLAILAGGGWLALRRRGRGVEGEVAG